MFKETLKKFLPSFLLSWYHFLLAFFGAVFYGFPARKLTVIGVTGTNGKSTVVELASKTLEEAGYKVASISSIQFKIKEREWENTLKQTMPGRFQLQRFLRKAVNSGCQYAVLEVTSEGIKQHRHRFIDFALAVFTNLTPEHIEAHGSFENYQREKGKLFQATKRIHIINLDDENAKYFLQFDANKKWVYGINWELGINPPGSPPKGVQRNWKFIKATDVNISSKGIDFSIEETRFHLNLLGGFNVYNTLAVICVGLSQGISLETCKKALEKVKGIPGRMEIVISQPFKVFVDYAFTPNALEKVYQTLATNYKLPITPKQNKFAMGQAKLICVLGAAGGGRDKWKRPILGKIAVKYCQQIIITNEDPYDENPIEIIKQVASGALEEIRVNPRRYPRQSASIQEILDRREAIKKALSLAKAGDAVVITGKGSEPWICVEKGKKIPWDDRKIVKEEFEKLNL